MPLLPQFGFFELILVAVVALIVVGPQDLPKLMRSAGKLAAQARRLASEFTSAFDQMAREAEMEEMRKEIEALKHDNVFSQTKRELEEAVRPVSDAVRAEAAEVKDAVSKPVSSPTPKDALAPKDAGDKQVEPAQSKAAGGELSKGQVPEGQPHD